MTPKDMLIQEQRRTIAKLEAELKETKALLHRASQYLSDDTFARIALEMTNEHKEQENNDFWEGE